MVHDVIGPTEVVGTEEEIKKETSKRFVTS